jgi:hypothetical protein
MKYLESFDLFDSAEYERMTRSRFIAEMNKMGSVDLSEEQRTKLSKLFKGFFGPESVGINPPDECFFYEVVKVGYFFIYPYDDEWYLIEILNNKTNRGEYYKCDGLEGIKKMLSDTFDVNEASISDLIKDLPKELTPPPAGPDAKLVTQHTCNERFNNKKLRFKIKWNNTAEHDLNKRIADRTSFQSIRHFNEIFKRFLDKIFPSMIGKEILVSGRYSFYFEEYNISIIVSIDVDRIMMDNVNEIFVITVLPGDVGINVVKTIVISDL